jgi:hypothetical protein
LNWPQILNSVFIGSLIISSAIIGARVLTSVKNVASAKKAE